jgi:uncharacterized DUF497 family protein
MKIVNDPPKRLENLKRHRLDFEELTVEFFETAEILPAKRGRYMAINRLGGHVLTVVFKRLGTEAISVISMRPASRKERKL